MVRRMSRMEGTQPKAEAADEYKDIKMLKKQEDCLQKQKNQIKPNHLIPILIESCENN